MKPSRGSVGTPEYRLRLFFLALLCTVCSQALGQAPLFELVPGLSQTAKNALVAHYDGRKGIEKGAGQAVLSWTPVDGNGMPLPSFKVISQARPNGGAENLITYDESDDSDDALVFAGVNEADQGRFLEGILAGSSASASYSVIWRGHYNAGLAGAAAWSIGPDAISHRRNSDGAGGFQVELFNGMTYFGNDITSFDGITTAWSTVVTANSHQARANSHDLQVAGLPAYSIPANPPIIIGGSGPSAFGFSGRIRHLLIFATALDAPDRILLERFLATSLVTNANDHGAGSLRQTLAEASPFSVVQFDPAVFNGEPGDVIKLETAITIADSVTIDASDIPAGVTIDGGSNGDAVADPGETRCFFISDGQADAQKTVAFRHLTIRNGVSSDFFQAGGNIHNRENLTLENCTIAGGRAVAFSAKGGGIYSESGSLTLKSSTVSGNQVIGDAASGGGICSILGELTLSGCTVSDNRALGDRADGGGIYHEAEIAGPVATLTNCTLFGNAASGRGGGYYNYEGRAQFVHCTLAGNTAAAGEGGGIASYGDESTHTELTATIVRNAASSDVDFVAESAVSFASAGANYVGTGSAISAFGAGAGDKIDGSTPILLAPLGNYGGPTAVMPPLAGSPAIDAVATLTIGTDQLGHPRPNGPLPDIGAVEAVPISTLALPDGDGDGIPDILEGPGGPYPHLTVGTDDSGKDTDGDGSRDAEEIANMTDPYNPGDRFEIRSFLPAPGFVSGLSQVFDVTVSTFPGLKYRLGVTQSLDTPFEPSAGSPITATGYEMTFTVTLDGVNDFVRAERVE